MKQPACARATREAAVRTCAGSFGSRIGTPKGLLRMAQFHSAVAQQRCAAHGGDGKPRCRRKSDEPVACPRRTASGRESNGLRLQPASAPCRESSRPSANRDYERFRCRSRASEDDEIQHTMHYECPMITSRNPLSSSTFSPAFSPAFSPHPRSYGRPARGECGTLGLLRNPASSTVRQRQHRL